MVRVSPYADHIRVTSVARAKCGQCEKVLIMETDDSFIAEERLEEKVRQEGWQVVGGSWVATGKLYCKECAAGV